MANLDEFTRNLLNGRNFPVVATASTDGRPASSVIWAGVEENSVIFVTGRNAPKARNIERNPRVSLVVYDHDNPYKAAEIRGRAQLLDEDPQSKLDELAIKYTGETYGPTDGTVVVRVTPEKVVPFDG